MGQSSENVKVVWENIPVGFSMHNEGYSAVRMALQVKCGDDVCVIAGCGDNAFNTLLEDPKSISAVDYSFGQIAQCNLKVSAIKLLPCADYCKFIGLGEDYDCPEIQNWREQIFREKLISALSAETAEFWGNHIQSLKMGIIHCGAFESLGLSKLRNDYLKNLISPEVIAKLRSARSKEEREDAIKSVDIKTLKVILSQFFIGMVVKGFPEDIRPADIQKSAEIMTERFFEILSKRKFSEGSFLVYLLTGKLSATKNPDLPFTYPENYKIVKERLNRISFVQASLTDHLVANKSSFDKIFLSNVGDHLTAEQQTAQCVSAANALKPTGGVVVDYFMWAWAKPWPKSVGGKFNEKLAEYICENIETSPLFDAPKIFELSGAQRRSVNS
jgi:S-adenosylmethionine:diacylglycerol 3-amino-3-carboxypropyl transferase